MINPLIGKRIKSLREINKYNQSDIEKFTGINRSKLSLIENGRSGITNEELYRISRFFGQSMEHFLEERVEPKDTQLLFRARGEFDEKDVETIIMCQEICRNYNDLKNIVETEGIQTNIRTYDIPATINWFKAAINVAQIERNQLGINEIEPIRDLKQYILSQGILLLAIPFESKVLDGFFFFNENQRPCIVINSSHKNPFSQNFVIAHEYCHVLVDFKERERFCNQIESATEIIERRANAFAHEFLMPKKAIDTYFSEKGYTKGNNQIDKHDLYFLIDKFKLSREIIANRLNGLDWITEEKRDEWLGLSKITREMNSLGYENEFITFYLKKKDRVSPELQKFRLLPKNYVNLAIKAYSLSKITYKKLAEYLYLSQRAIEDQVGIISKQPTLKQALGLQGI